MRCIIYFLLFFITTAVISLAIQNQNVFGQFGMSPLPTPGKIMPTYIIDIPAGAWKKDGIHFYPQNIAIPSGTTVAWFNDDPGQPHTVTGDKPWSQDSRKAFNAIVQYTSFAQHKFDKQGLYTYYCEYHPWMIGSVYVSESYEIGNDFVFSPGTNLLLENGKFLWDFNKTKNDRILFSIQPTKITTEESTPLTYNLSLEKDNAGILFSKNFFVRGNDFQVELIQSYKNNYTTVYGPDFSDPITGAYHIESNFEDGSYNVIIKINAIGNDILKEPLIDKFQGRIQT